MKLFLTAILFCLLTFSYAAPKTLDVYDLTSVNKYLGTREGVDKAWDTMHTLVCLQGLANRKTPNLYFLFVDSGKTDQFWLNKMTAKGAWLENIKINKIESYDKIFKKYRSYYRGLVVYDGNVPSTSNVASTVAGVEDLIAVRYDKRPGSMYNYLTKTLNIPVKKWLVNSNGSSLFTGKGIIPGTNRKSSGSAKNDAYIWAKINYLDKGKCSNKFLGYYMDYYGAQITAVNSVGNLTLVNQDFQIANKSFIFDLNVWEDEAPVDDKNQKKGLDLETFKEILKSSYKQAKGQMVQASGFTPWAFKYTSFGKAGGTHDGVPTEWRHAELLSNYNTYMDADALGYSDMANASVFSKCPLKGVYKQKKPTLDDLKAAGLIDESGKVKPQTYLTYYVGDYDSAAWLYQCMPRIWEDPTRGEVPLGWAINPQLAQRFAFGMDYFRKTATKNDSFVAGDSGAGYLNPGSLTEPREFSGLPDGTEAWKIHNQKWFRQFDISIVGFVIDGFAPPMNDKLLDIYAKIAPDGIGGQYLPSNQGVYKNKMPYIVMGPLDRMEDYENISQAVGSQVPGFVMLRNILWEPKSQKEFYLKMKESLNGDLTILEPHSFFLLMKYFYETKQTKEYKKSDNIFHFINGVEILDHSEIIQGFEALDAFMANTAKNNSQEVIFADKQTDNAIHYITFKLKEPTEIARFVLKLKGDHNSKGRNADGARIYAKSKESDEWQIVWSEKFNPNDPYMEKININLKEKINAQYFRLELDQHQRDEAGESNMGPRLLEIEAYPNL